MTGWKYMLHIQLHLNITGWETKLKPYKNWTQVKIQQETASVTGLVKYRCDEFMHCSLMNMGSGEHSMSHNTVITCVFFQFLNLKMFPFHSLKQSKLLKCISAELTRQPSITLTILVHEIKTKWLWINRVRLAYYKRSR